MLFLNASKRVQLLTTVFIPNWIYGTLFLPNDSMFKAIDAVCLLPVRVVGGMERNELDVHKSHKVFYVTTVLNVGSPGPTK